MLVIPPFRFNVWKHHLPWVKQQLNVIRDNPDNLILKAEIIEQIKSINSNHIDIYTGIMEPSQIIQAVDEQLQLLLIGNRNDFVSLLNQSGFYLVTLPDQSIWVLREGIEDTLYIHLHPARNSPNAVRIHGNTWKTVVLLKMFYSTSENINLTMVNEIRVKYLDLSPIKDLESSQRLVSAVELFTFAGNGSSREDHFYF